MDSDYIYLDLKMKNRLLSVCVLFMGLWAVSWQTVDLNLRQLQYVSDHLTTKECRKLITALHQKSFQLSLKQLRPVKDREPCLVHLTTWNQGQDEAEGSVEDLTLRLHQIGRTDLARDIAQAVYGETAREIHKNFLDNPFKKMAERHGSRLMEDEEEEEDTKRTWGAVDYIREGVAANRRFALSVIALTLTFICVSATVVHVYCPGACATTCPKPLVAAFEAMRESLKETLGTLRSLTAKEMLGVKTSQPARRPQDPASREEQDRLVQSLLATV